MVDTQVADDIRQVGLAPVDAGHATLTKLISGIADDAQRLIQQQYQMLRAEVREDLRRTKSVVVYLGIECGRSGRVFALLVSPFLNWALNCLRGPAGNHRHRNPRRGIALYIGNGCSPVQLLPTKP